MFVYQNVNRDICVTFKSNKPVAEPEYVIAIDNEAGTLTVNGQLMVASTEAAEETETEVVEEAAPVTEPEVVEEVDSKVDETEDSEEEADPVEE